MDLARVAGSGLAGRVTKKDILSFIESGTQAAAPPKAAPSPVRPGPEGIVHPTVEAWPGDRVEAMSKIRKLTADHMIMSRRTSAHVTSFYEVDFSRLAVLRRAKKAEYERRGAKLTYMAFIIKVIADNLRRHPVLNASVSGDQIIYRQSVNVGIAVALEWGLIVPVIRHADELSVLGIARSVADLAERARTKRLSPDEVQHGTFTITNPGVFGSYIGAPIINQPQVAILGIGAIEKRPKVLPGRRAGRDRHSHDGHAVALVRPPDRGRGGRGPVHGGRETRSRAVPRRSGVSMARRAIEVNGERWTVFPSGSVTVYDRDEFALVFVKGTGPHRVERVVRYSPLGVRRPDLALAQLSDTQLTDLLRCSQPAATSPHARYASGGSRASS